MIVQDLAVIPGFQKEFSGAAMMKLHNLAVQQVPLEFISHLSSSDLASTDALMCSATQHSDSWSTCDREPLDKQARGSRAREPRVPESLTQRVSLLRDFRETLKPELQRGDGLAKLNLLGGC
jgi:hypothetical protein